MLHHKKKIKLINFDNDYQKEEPKPKKIRWWRKISPLSYLMVFLAVIIWLIAYVFSPFGHVSQVTVTGVNYLGEQQVIDASKINTNSIVIQTLFQKKKIEQNIKKEVPLIKNVNYHYHDYNKLQIDVEEYKTVGFVIKNDGYYRVLENSKIIKPKLRQPIGNFPIYQTFGPKTSLNKIVKFYSSIPHNLQSDISEIHGSKNTVRHPYRLTIYLNDGNMVIGDIRTLSKKLEFYPAIAKQMPEKGIVNLEVGAYSKAYPPKK